MAHFDRSRRPRIQSANAPSIGFQTRPVPQRLDPQAQEAPRYEPLDYITAPVSAYHEADSNGHLHRIPTKTASGRSDERPLFANNLSPHAPAAPWIDNYPHLSKECIKSSESIERNGSKVTETSALPSKKDIEEDDSEFEEGDDEYLDEIYQIIDSVVPRTDDPSLPALTFRVWLLGLGFGIILSIVNTILSFRVQNIQITPFLTVLLAYPIGVMMANCLPSGIFNPGPFNYKEHALIYILTNGVSMTPYAIYNIVGQKYKFYQPDLSLVSCFAFAIITQCFGYGFAGLSQRFLIRPAAMLWPQNFATIAMLNSLHLNTDISMGRYPMSRYRFFWLVATAIFFYSLLPQFAAPMLASFSLICFFVKNNSNNTLAVALGSSQLRAGLGLLSFSFDWSNFTSIFLPITTPLWAMINQMIGTYIFMWIIVPICWYYNAFEYDRLVGSFTQHGFELNSPNLFTRDGSMIDVTQFVTMNNESGLELNQDAYNQAAPVLITTYFAVYYAASFLVFTSAIVHVGLWYGKDIWVRFRMSIHELDLDDPHVQLMKAYPEVPEWWYYLLLGITTIGAVVVCLFGGFQLPWWGVLLAITLALVSILPLGIIQAISGQQLGLNVIAEFVSGLILPGKITAVMTFKTFSYMAMAQGLLLSQDLKLGHYIKIPPRDMFTAQLVSTMVGAVVSVGTVVYLYEAFGVISDINDSACLVDQGCLTRGWMYRLNGLGGEWSTISYDVFASAGAIWGAIGPARFFGPGSVYFKTLLGFAVGAILPVIPWVMHKIQPDSFWHLINIPLLAILPMQPGSQVSNLITPLIVAVIVNFYIKKYRHTWWKKYAYVMSSALDAGTAMCALLVFFATRVNSDYTVSFPYWAMNPPDSEACYSTNVLDCMARINQGNAFGGKYNVSLDSPFCQDVYKTLSNN